MSQGPCVDNQKTEKVSLCLKPASLTGSPNPWLAAEVLDGAGVIISSNATMLSLSATSAAQVGDIRQVACSL